MIAPKKNARNSKRGTQNGPSIPTSNRIQAGKSIASLAAIHAKRIAEPAHPISLVNRASATSSSALLMSFAHALWYARIRRLFGVTLPGLGGDFDLNLNRLVTLCCPLDCEPVALGHSTGGNECSCSVSFPTPTATDWRGGKKKRKAGTQANLRDEFTQRTGLLYLHPEDCEAALGLPTTWTELTP